jgi:FlaA1/EpsC-like NDP-sugar epimerase
MTIPEASQLVLQSGAYAMGGEIFVLDMGEPVRIYDLALDLIRLSGFKPNEDIDIEIIGLRPGEKLYEELLMDDSLGTTDNKKIFVDKPETLEHRLLVKFLYNFKDIIKKHDPQLLREAIKGLVPTYQLNETVNRDFIESRVQEKINLGQ